MNRVQATCDKLFYCSAETSADEKVLPTWASICALFPAVDQFKSGNPTARQFRQEDLLTQQNDRSANVSEPNFTPISKQNYR